VGISVGAELNNRRKLIIALGAGSLVSPFATFAQQQGKVWRVGFLSVASRPASLDSFPYGAIPKTMRELGYVEGKNLEIEWRFAHGKSELLPGLVAELMQLKVDLIICASSTTIQVAQKATTTIPIVMAVSGDPVASGFVKSLAHPGGNITGNANFTSEISTKQLDMLRVMVPKLSRVAVLMNPTQPTHPVIFKSIQAAAEKIGVKVFPEEAQTSSELESAFSVMSKNRMGAVIVLPDGIFNAQLHQISQLAVSHRLPSIATVRQYAEAGGLMNYGPSLTESFRNAVAYVDRILKGAKPGDLPVAQPTKFEMIINGKTAKTLGLKIPQSLLISADKIIE
jgi:putative ABC transport system substrate-binding protein